VVADLRARRVSSVIVGPMRRGADVVRLFTLALGVPPRHLGGVDVWYGVPTLLTQR
jgi:hypothetical protein